MFTSASESESVEYSEGGGGGFVEEREGFDGLQKGMYSMVVTGVAKFCFSITVTFKGDADID